MSTVMAESHPEADWGALDKRWMPLVRLGDDVKQTGVALALGIDPGDLSRFKKGQFKLNAHQFYALLEQVGAKVVDKSAKCMSDEAFRFINECPELAQKVLRQQPHLIWDDK